jgi:hypothetical protein
MRLTIAVLSAKVLDLFKIVQNLDNWAQIWKASGPRPNYFSMSSKIL